VTETQAAGPIIDGLGVTFHLDPDDRVTEVLILAKTTDLNTGEVGLSLASNGLDWIAQIGLLTAANVVLLDVDVVD